jgi:hypothetical protein
MKKILSSVFLAVGGVLSSSLAVFAAVSDDQYWDNQFGPPGVNSLAEGIAAIGNKIYAGGLFTAAGGVKTPGVAGFDGTNWFPLNGGLPYPGGGSPAVISLATDNNYLYAGGLFSSGDDPTAIDTARWDGTNWSGIGVQGIVAVVKRNGSNVYFGGEFNGVGNVAATNIARWDGTNWFTLGSGLSSGGLSSVNCMAIQGNNIYAGGTFSYSGASAMTNIAYWDGSAWHAMGNPFNGIVDALQFYGGYLYAGGTFTNISLHFTNIARWNGGAWSAVPGGGANQGVYDMTTDGTNLYVGGIFTQIGGIPGTNIVSFDGTTWEQLGGGLHYFQNGLGQANKLLWWSNQLFVAGGFDRAGDNAGAAYVARWDGTNWWSLGGDTSKGMSPAINFVQTLCNVPASGSIAGGLYAGGLFSTAGKTNAHAIARYDGTNWNPLGGGVSGWFISSARVYAIATDGTDVYAGGNFTNADLFTGVGGLAYWNGNGWWPLYYGMDYIVNALAVDGYGRLWIGGQFTNAVSITYAKGLAVWDWNTGGGTYVNYGNVDGTNATVGAIAYDGGTRVYVGGQFYSVGGVSATNIAYYDYNDGLWHPLSLGLNTKVSALAYGNGKLYAGGTFTQAGSLAVNRIAQWDGANWSALNSGITGASSSSGVNCIAIAGGNVYVAGNFTNAGGVLASNVAVWNGSSWSALGSGTASSTSPTVSAVAASGNDIYIGGQFTFAGDKPAQFIAHWNSQSNYYPAANMKLTRSMWQTNRQFRFRVTGTSGQSYIIQGSTNLNTWTPLQTNSTMFYDFSDTNSSSNPRRFYRTVLGP